VFKLNLTAAILLVLGTGVTPLVGANAGCLNIVEDYGSAKAAAITGGQPRIYFIQGAEHAGCPNATQLCRAKAYLGACPGNV
jgi:hypothetical protein